MKRAHEQVSDFHRLVGASIGDVAKPDATVDYALRIRLIAEEFEELMEAVAPGFEPRVKESVERWLGSIAECNRVFDSSHPEPDLPAVADALADLEYVTVGSAVSWGIPGGAVWDEVHAANMRKAGGPKDANGKALKPPGWKGPDIEGVLKREADEATRWSGHQRGDQLHEPYGQFGSRWVLDEPGPNERTWWAYLKAPDGTLGYRSLIDITIAPRKMEPLPCDPLPDRVDE